MATSARNCAEESNDNQIAPDYSQQYGAKVAAVKVPRSKQPGGYDCEFVEKPPSIIQTECSICLQILRSPKMISCCGHSFCGTCIDRIKNDGKSCPLCNAEDFSLMLNKALERSLNELDVKCSYFEEGCCWTGELGEFSSHVNVGNVEKPSSACSFVEVKCRHDCGDYFERRSIELHEDDECPKRPFSCDYCRDYSSTFEDVAYNHYPVCDSYPMPCPNKCDRPYAIERRDLANHIANDCPLTVVNCDFHYAGCEVRLPREDMPDHLKENVTHLSLMAAKLMEKDTQIATLTGELMKRQDDLAAENDDLKKKLKQKIDIQIATLTSERLMRMQYEALKQEIAELRGDTDAQITELREDTEAQMLQIKEATNRCSTIQARSERTIQSMTDKLQHNVKTFRTELTASMVDHKKTLDEKFLSLCSQPPCTLVMTNFDEHMTENEPWISQPFYTHPRGYKMCIDVYANGNGEGEGTHVSVFVYLMRGEFDDHLKWPFRGVITVQLLNQSGEEGHHEKTFRFTDTIPAGERAANGWGNPQFIAHHRLKPNYLQNDELHFCILKINSS